MLNVSWRRVQRLAAEGKLGLVPIGSGQRRIMFRRGDVDEVRRGEALDSFKR